MCVWLTRPPIVFSILKFQIYSFNQLNCSQLYPSLSAFSYVCASNWMSLHASCWQHEHSCSATNPYTSNTHRRVQKAINVNADFGFSVWLLFFFLFFWTGRRFFCSCRDVFLTFGTYGTYTRAKSQTLQQASYWKWRNKITNDNSHVTQQRVANWNKLLSRKRIFIKLSALNSTGIIHVEYTHTHTPAIAAM